MPQLIGWLISTNSLCANGKEEEEEDEGVFFLREKRLSVCQFESAGRRRLKKKKTHTQYFIIFIVWHKGADQQEA